MQKLIVEIRIESEFGDYSAKDIERALNRAFPTSADFYVTETRLTQREPDSLKAGDSCLPAVVKSESNLPA